MGIEGVEETIKTLKQFQDALKRLQPLTEQIVVSDSQRVGSTKDQIEERGPLKDRLAKTTEEAEILARVHDVRSGQPSDEPTDLTAEQQEEIDDAIANRLIDDIIEKTILRGL